MTEISDAMRDLFTDGGQRSLDEGDFDTLREMVREEKVALRELSFGEPSQDVRLARLPEAEGVRGHCALAAGFLERSGVAWSVDSEDLATPVGRVDMVSGDGSLVVHCTPVTVTQIVEALEGGWGVLLVPPQLSGRGLMYTPARYERKRDQEQSNLLGDLIRIAAVSGIVEVALNQLVGVAGLGLIPLVLLLAWQFLLQARAGGLLDTVVQAGVAVAIIVVLVNPRTYLRNGLLLGLVGAIYAMTLIASYRRLPLRLRMCGPETLFRQLPRNFRLQFVWYIVFTAIMLVAAAVFVLLAIQAV